MSSIMAQPPPPKDLSHHLSRNAKARTASSIKSFYKYFSIPGIAQLAGGLPNNSYFPFDTLEAKVARPARFRPTPNDPVDPPSSASSSFANLSLRSSAADKSKSPPQDEILVPHTSSNTLPTAKIDLDTALQYGQALGYPPLFDFLRTFARKHLHPNNPYAGGPEVILTCGNTDGFSKVLQLLTDDWSEDKDWVRDRDGLLVERFCYMNALQAARPKGLNVVSVDVDEEGMRTEGKGGLRDVLENWNWRRGRRPRLMYTVTMGQNPTSGVLSLQRRRDIYALCCKYDIIIVEDDPYWYLQYPSSTNKSVTTGPTFINGEAHPTGWKSTGYDFLDSLVPSSVSIDTEGRVIRLDTFSKFVAPGCRLGWITAQPALVERILRITETSTQQPSGFVQSLVAEMLMGSGDKGESEGHRKGGKNEKEGDEGWQYDGWVRWLEGLRGNYERRMSTMSDVLDESRTLVTTLSTPSSAEDWSVVSKKDILSFTRPQGGMFLWLHINFPTHPLYAHYKSLSQLSRLSQALWVFWTTKAYRVLVAPGTMFSPTPEIAAADGWQYFRVCFAAIDEDGVKGASENLASGVRAFWEIEDEDVIEGLLEDIETAGEREGLTPMMGWC